MNEEAEEARDRALLLDEDRCGISGRGLWSMKALRFQQ